MSYRDVVAKRITGDRDALDRRKELWDEIASAYEKEGEEGVKSILMKRAFSMTEEFNNLIGELEDEFRD